MRTPHPRTWIPALTALALLVTSGCAGPGDGALNGLWLVVELGEREGLDQPAVYGDLTVDELTVEVASATFEAAGPDGDETISAAVETSLELVSGAAVPGTPVVELSVGDYDDVRIAIELPKEGDLGVEMYGFLGGIPFALAYTGGGDLEAATDHLALDDGLDAVVHYRLRPDAWLDGLDLAGAETDGEGVVLLDADHNPELYDSVASRLFETLETEFPAD